ncbi:MAG: hypothetical protein JOS17DRAFT_91278 [Linnemannia elongata]|nr:MAG: hypothetical protein JOS17DRAFT_91278 [Linnemannia elongata]
MFNQCSAVDQQGKNEWRKRMLTHQHAPRRRQMYNRAFPSGAVCPVPCLCSSSTIFNIVDSLKIAFIFMIPTVVVMIIMMGPSLILFLLLYAARTVLFSLVYFLLAPTSCTAQLLLVVTHYHLQAVVLCLSMTCSLLLHHGTPPPLSICSLPFCAQE